jgi:hypothetical protein
MGRIQHAATAKDDARRRRAFEKISPRGHVSLPGKPRFPLAGRQPVFDFFTRHIAKPKAKGQ